jgi:hypothetical protein
VLNGSQNGSQNNGRQWNHVAVGRFQPDGIGEYESGIEKLEITLLLKSKGVQSPCFHQDAVCCNALLQNVKKADHKVAKEKIAVVWWHHVGTPLGGDEVTEYEYFLFDVANLVIFVAT